MTIHRPGEGDSPNSAFVREMWGALDRLGAAQTLHEKRAVEREMEQIMRRYLGCREVPLVDRPIDLPSVCHVEPEAVDRKSAAAGRDE